MDTELSPVVLDVLRSSLSVKDNAHLSASSLALFRGLAWHRQARLATEALRQRAVEHFAEYGCEWFVILRVLLHWCAVTFSLQS